MSEFIFPNTVHCTLIELRKFNWKKLHSLFSYMGAICIWAIFGNREQLILKSSKIAQTQISPYKSIKFHWIQTQSLNFLHLKIGGSMHLLKIKSVDFHNFKLKLFIGHMGFYSSVRWERWYGIWKKKQREKLKNRYEFIWYMSSLSRDSLIDCHCLVQISGWCTVFMSISISFQLYVLYKHLNNIVDCMNIQIDRILSAN